MSTVGDSNGGPDPVEVFGGRLRQLQAESGSPSVRELESLTERIGAPFRRSTIQDKLAGRTTPDWVFVVAFVRACALHAGTPTDPDLKLWWDWHKQMLRELAARRRGQRRAGDAARTLAGSRGPMTPEAAGEPGSGPRSLESVARIIPESLDEVSEQPSLLLRPERQIIDFIGRRQELADLIKWCHDATAGRLRLITGPGGVGKTRLAIELCRRLSAEGWRCFEILDGVEGNALAKIRESESGQVLVIVDYAETRLELKQFLRGVVADQGPALRVLLLARSAGGWWEQLSAMDFRIREMISGAQYELRSAIEEQISDAAIVTKAAYALAERVGVEIGEVTFAEGPTRTRILDLLVAALAALLSAKADGAGTIAPLRVDLQQSIPKLMEHEQRFWVGSAERAELLSGPDGLAPGTLRRVVAAGCLLGATSETEAVQLLTRVPNMRTQLKAALWLRELYPPEPGGSLSEGKGDWLGRLQPDRLAEFHVARELESCPELADNCLKDLDLRQALRAYTLLSRAATDYPGVQPLFDQMLMLVAPVAGMKELPSEALMIIADGMPFPAVELTIVHNAVVKYFNEAPLVTNGPQWEMWLATLSAYLTRLARLIETRQTDGPSWGLAEAKQALEVSYPQTASSLAAMGRAFSETGRPGAGLAPMEEAVAIYRGLAQVYPEKYGLTLRECLFTLSSILENFGRVAEAENVQKEARTYGATVAVTASADTIAAVAASADTITRVRRLNKDHERIERTGHTSEIVSIACARLGDGSLVAASVGHYDSAVQVRSVENGSLRYILDHDGLFVSDVRFRRLSDGRDIAVTLAKGILNENNTIWVWDMANGRNLHVLRGHKARPLSVAFSRLSDCRDLAISTSDDYTARVWDLASGNCEFVLKGHELWVWSVDCTQLDSTVTVGVTTSSDSTARVWNLADGRLMHVLRHAESIVWDVACARLSNGLDIAVTVDSDGDARAWDLRNGSLLHTFHRHSGMATGVACVKLADIDLAVTTSHDGTARVWNLSDGSFLYSIECSTTEKPTCTQFSDGTPVAILARGKSIAIIDLALHSTEIVALPGPASITCAAPGQDTIVASFGREMVRLDKNNLHQWHFGRALTPDSLG